MRNHQIANGEIKAELVLKNCRIIDVFNHVIEHNDIAIEQGIIVGIGDYKGFKEIDMKNKYVSPGFIDGHVHIESSMLTPTEFSRIVIPRGTTRVIADPHEIANVLGVKGIGFMFRSGQKTPLNLHLMVPSCVPATEFETNGSTISNEDIYSLKERVGILGLGEVMDYPSVINGEPNMLNKLSVIKDKIIDGHAPLVTGKQLNSYLLENIKTDHECTNIEELNEKVSRGMYVHLREGSATRNVEALVNGITPYNSNRLLFCTDDKHPMDIIREGHIDYNINLAIKHNVDPITAIQMATINIATCYELRQVGAIAPGYIADLVTFNDIQNINVEEVYIKGVLVASNKEPLFEVSPFEDVHVINSVKLNLQDVKFDLSLKDSYVKVIKLIPNNVTTNKVMRTVTVENGLYKNNPDEDILKIAVVERHHYTKNIGLGLIEGYGLKNGAIAMSIAHDSHNIVVVGDNDEDMFKAVSELYKIQGGIVVVSNNEVKGTLQLEIAGLMTNKSYTHVNDKLKELEEIAFELGINKEVDDPFLSLAFMSLPVIPELKLTDKSLFDVIQFKPVEIEGE